MNVLTVEPESMPTKKVAPPAEEKTQASAREPSINDVIAGVDPAKVKMAEKMGIPLGQLLAYMKYQEDKLNLVIENMPKKEDMSNAFKQGLEDLQKQQMEQYQQATTSGQGMPQGRGTGSLGQFIPLLNQIVGGGGGGDPEIASLTKEMFRMNIEGMKADIGFTKALKAAMLSKYAGGLVKEVGVV